MRSASATQELARRFEATLGNDLVLAFSRAAHDSHAHMHGRKRLWDQVDHDRQQHFVSATVTAAYVAERSQYSQLARERLTHPPDPRRVFFETFATMVDGEEALTTPLRQERWRVVLATAAAAVQDAPTRSPLLPLLPPPLEESEA